MKTNITCIFVFFIIYTFASCKQKSSGIDTLTVNLEHFQSVSFFDLFSQIEIIPLETNENSLIKNITKIELFEDKLYILDQSKSEVLIFNSKGNFLKKISDRGQGPDQYLNISDFDIDVANREITLLAPVNTSIYDYDLGGNFVTKYKLPTITGAYSRFKHLNGDTIVLWTFDEKNRIKFYSKSQNANIHETYPEKHNILNNFTPFIFPYENYFCRSSDNTVYEINNNCEIIAKYKWDFMNLNNNEKTIRKFETIPSSELRDYTNSILNSEEINYVLSLHGGTSKYYYTQLWRKNKRINVFYDKVKKIQYAFDKTTENASFYPLTWNNKYVIGFYSELLCTIDETLPDAILNNEAIKIKGNLSEYDNPILIKYYFKK